MEDLEEVTGAVALAEAASEAEEVPPAVVEAQEAGKHKGTRDGCIRNNPLSPFYIFH